MFRTARPKSSLHSAAVSREPIYHAPARSIRRKHGNTIVALGLIGAFYTRKHDSLS